MEADLEGLCWNIEKKAERERKFCLLETLACKRIYQVLVTWKREKIALFLKSISASSLKFFDAFKSQAPRMFFIIVVTFSPHSLDCHTRSCLKTPLSF